LIIRLTAVDGARDFETSGLRARAAKAPQLATTHLFRATSGSEEVALVVLDIHPNARCYILYEVFLCSPHRNRGVGTRVLAAIEDFVSTSGCSCLEVWPRSLDVRNRSDTQLVAWYRRHGYVSAQAGSERLVKTLIPRQTSP
jgi:GNAT superfamily N-acetyltransferase